MLNRPGLEYKCRNLYPEDEVPAQFGNLIKNYSRLPDQNKIHAGSSPEIFKNIKLEFGQCYIMQDSPNRTDIDIQNAV